MRFLHFAGLAGVLAAVALCGCGGGGGSAPAGTSIVGQALAPDSQTRAASYASRAGDPLVPLAGATVTVHDVTTGQDVTSLVTDSTGHYTAANLTVGHNYVVRISKVVPAGTLIIKAVVTCEAGANSKDVTPTTTVAAAAVEVKLQSHPELKDAPLQAIADDLASHAASAPPPVLTDPSAVTAAAGDLITTTLPTGSYLGGYDGPAGHTGVLCAVFVNGKFLLTAINQDAPGTFANPGYCTGEVDSAGSVTGQSTDGNVTIKGSFASSVGTGTWVDKHGYTGTWKLKAAAQSFAGLYSGVWTATGLGRSGLFILAIMDDRKVFVFAAPGSTATPAGRNAGENQDAPDVGVGRLADDNTINVTINHVQNGQVVSHNTVAGSYSPTDGSVHGTYETSEREAGTWTGSRAQLSTELPISSSASPDLPPAPPSR